ASQLLALSVCLLDTFA
ncbi:DUF645 family protein, partial [Vibrio cholerae]